MTALTDKELKGLRRRQGARVFALTVVLVLTGLFVAANKPDLTVDWLFDQSTVSLAVIFGALWASGLVCGLLLARPVRAGETQTEPKVIELGERPRRDIEEPTNESPTEKGERSPEPART